MRCGISRTVPALGKPTAGGGVFGLLTCLASILTPDQLVAGHVVSFLHMWNVPDMIARYAAYDAIQQGEHLQEYQSIVISWTQACQRVAVCSPRNILIAL
jgi:hypothetical protein